MPTVRTASRKCLVRTSSKFRRSETGYASATSSRVTQYKILQGRDADQYWLPPSITDMQAIDGTIRLTMSSEIKTRDDSEGKLLGFAIAGEDRRFYPADVQWYSDGSVDSRNQPRYQRNVLVLSSPFVPEPAHYRHAWARNPLSNIVNVRGVSLATQRSDDWLLEETPEKINTPENMSEDAARRFAAGQIRRKLELADLERRVQEAEATIAELKPTLDKAKDQ
jgi:sialate O-acetylesterase